jgi:hypothetical protein
MNVANFLEIWAPGGPGSATKFSYTGSASTAQVLRPALTAGGFVIQQPPQYISFCVRGADLITGAQAHLVFGDASVGVPTDNDYPITNSDGWQSLIIPASCTHFRIKGHAATTGDFWFYFSGRLNP